MVGGSLRRRDHRRLRVGTRAIDMFNLTASMAVAMKAFAQSGFRPRGTLIYAAVADEEAGGEFGARFLAEREPDAVACDFLVTESGGFPMPSPAGVRMPYLHEEKGPLWATMKVHGAPCHGSMPFHADNTLREGRRSRSPHRRLSTSLSTRRVVARLRRRTRASRRASGAASPRGWVHRDDRDAAPRVVEARVLEHPHDHHADDVHGRFQGEHHPGRSGHRT